RGPTWTRSFRRGDASPAAIPYWNDPLLHLTRTGPYPGLTYLWPRIPCISSISVSPSVGYTGSFDTLEFRCFIAGVKAEVPPRCACRSERGCGACGRPGE